MGGQVEIAKCASLERTALSLDEAGRFGEEVFTETVDAWARFYGHSAGVRNFSRFILDVWLLVSMCGEW